MQLLAILAVVGLLNIVGVGVMSGVDPDRNAASRYQGTVEVEDVSADAKGSLLEAIRS